MDDANSTENQPPPGSSDGSQHAGSNTLGNGELKSASTETARAIKHRKRTKTGCLSGLNVLPLAVLLTLTGSPACRKRRIKCGEERPTCANCVKSRRSCEGYAPRLTFRDPLSAIVPGWQVREHFSIPTGNGVAGQVARSANGNQLPAILPRPMPISQLPLPPVPPPQAKLSSKPLVNGFQPTTNSFNVPPSNPEVPPLTLHEPYRGPSSQTQQFDQSAGVISGSGFTTSAPQPVSQYPVEIENNAQAAYNSQWLQQSAPLPPALENDPNQLHFFHPPIDHIPEQAVFSGTQYSIPQTTAPDISYSLAPVNEPSVSLPESSTPNGQAQNTIKYPILPYSQLQHERWVEGRAEEPSNHIQGTYQSRLGHDCAPSET